LLRASVSLSGAPKRGPTKTRRPPTRLQATAITFVTSDRTLLFMNEFHNHEQSSSATVDCEWYMPAQSALSNANSCATTFDFVLEKV